MQNIDQSLFYFINTGLANGIFDEVMPFITDLHKNQFFIKVFFPLILVTWAYKKRLQALLVLLGLVMCISAVDSFTYRVLKPTFKRERPPAVETQIILRSDRYAGFSFPSNHAANNFAGATFLSFCYPALTPLFYAVASLVAFSRVYVGVHYPGDILAGSILGSIFGLFFFKFWFILLNRLGHWWPILRLPSTNKSLGVRDEDE